MKREPVRVLVVEHSEADMELAVKELERGGFEVLSEMVATPEDFLGRLRSGVYDIVLADYRLPDWTGMDALALLQANGWDIPLILVTGSLGDVRAVECVKQGASDYVLKDNLIRLPMAVRRALEERRLRDERTQAGYALNATEERYRVLFESMPLPVWVFDVETHRVLAVNAAAVQHYGYSREEFFALRIEDLRPREDIVRLQEHARTSPRNGGIQSSEGWRHRKKDGSLILVDLTRHSVTWDSRPAVIVAANDITERTRAEEALRESEERFRQLADNSKELFFINDPNTGSTIYLSPAYEEIWGRSRESAYATPGAWLEAIHPEDRARLAAVEADGRSRDTTWDVFRVLRPDGSMRWVRSHASPVRDAAGRVSRVVGIAEDFTDRRRAEEALAESESRYRKVIEASFDGIDITEGGVIREANRGFAEMFGYAQDEVIGKPILDFVADESVEAVRQRGTEGLDGSYELVGKRKDGTKILLEATARTHSVGGRPGRLTALRDVTEKRLLEDQFRQAQKMEAVGRLAGGVAHDFNNLLTVIISCVELTLMDTEEGDPRRENLEEIRKASQAGAGLTRQLLAFSRQQVIEPKLLTIEEVVETAEKMLQRLIGEDVELVAVLNKNPATVKIDPGQLEQVIMNLAVNARDAMPHGGKLTLETSAVELDKAYARSHWPATPGRFSLLTVSDTGSGMTTQTRARLFEPFFTTKGMGKGTGLGLATVYGIVKQSGGFIWVYSEPGQGATFKIYLPRVDEPPTAGHQLATTTSLLGTETILLAEDAPALRATARQILERYGYTVLEAPSSTAALALACSRPAPIHLLLTDVVMPEMSGRELAERFSAKRPGVKILYMSGYTDDAVVRHGVLRPGIAYLQKPFTPEALARKVREVLDASSHP